MRGTLSVSLVLLPLLSGVTGAQDTRESRQTSESSGVVREPLTEYFSEDIGMGPLIIGEAMVLDAYTLEFEDGTVIRIGLLNAPNLEQQCRIGGALYACGEEAAEFLRTIVGDQTVMYFSWGDGSEGSTYAGETDIAQAMILNGWSLAVQSTHMMAEIIAQKNERGLWRGEFVVPSEWREGRRLQAE